MKIFLRYDLVPHCRMLHQATYADVTGDNIVAGFNVPLGGFDDEDLPTV